jgi:hypothetical protein
MGRLRKDSKCHLHNREAHIQNGGKGTELSQSESVKLGFCSEPNAFRCDKVDCSEHVDNDGGK